MRHLMENEMPRNDALKYIYRVLDDSLNVTRVSEGFMKDDAHLVGWECGFEPMFVAVQSYLPDVRLTEQEAIDLAMDFLTESKWFSDGPVEPDYIL
jgi:hypothetical protein